MVIRALREIVHPGIVTNFDSTIPDKAVVKLVETGNTKLSELQLVIPTHDCLIFKLDASGKSFRTKSSYLNPRLPGLHQGCDYVVTCVYRGRLHFILIELKSDSYAGANSQLWHSAPFVRYLESLLETHFPDASHEDCTLSFLLFSTAAAHKLKATTTHKIPKSRDPRGFDVYIGGSPKRFYLSSIIG